MQKHVTTGMIRLYVPPQTAGSSGPVSETAEGKELCSCAHLYLTRWAKAQQQIYEVDVYNFTR